MVHVIRLDIIMAYHIPTYCKFVYFDNRYIIGILINRILLDDKTIVILVLPDPLNSPHKLLNHPMKNAVNIEYFAYSKEISINLGLAVVVKICITY